MSAINDEDVRRVLRIVEELREGGVTITADGFDFAAFLMPETLPGFMTVAGWRPNSIDINTERFAKLVNAATDASGYGWTDQCQGCGQRKTDCYASRCSIGALHRELADLKANP